jgi:cytochrome c-type biogenesis protein CcmH
MKPLRTTRSRPVRTGTLRRIARRTLAAFLTGALVLAGFAAPASAAPVRASLPAIESQVMCVTCKIPLNVAQSPQSDRERAFIQSLIDEGQNEAEIKSALVAQYGPTVLALPSTHGFDLAAYLVPLLALVAVLGLLATLLPRWRRESKSAVQTSVANEEVLSPADTARLEADLARFD